MKAGEILVGQLFRLPGKRKKYVKLRNYGQLSRPVTDDRNNIIHDGNNQPVFVPCITVRTMSGKKFDMPKDKEVIPIL